MKNDNEQSKTDMASNKLTPEKAAAQLIGSGDEVDPGVGFHQQPKAEGATEQIKDIDQDIDRSE
jgi:hypothetical protein